MSALSILRLAAKNFETLLSAKSITAPGAPRNDTAQDLDGSFLVLARYRHDPHTLPRHRQPCFGMFWVGRFCDTSPDASPGAWFDLCWQFVNRVPGSPEWSASWPAAQHQGLVLDSIDPRLLIPGILNSDRVPRSAGHPAWVDQECSRHWSCQQVVDEHRHARILCSADIPWPERGLKWLLEPRLYSWVSNVASDHYATASAGEVLDRYTLPGISWDGIDSDTAPESEADSSSDEDSSYTRESTASILCHRGRPHFGQDGASTSTSG